MNKPETYEELIKTLDEFNCKDHNCNYCMFRDIGYICDILLDKSFNT